MDRESLIMEKYIDNIVRKIVEVAKKENNELMKIADNNLNSELGIFHMPELAFAYMCGKKIMQDSYNIFGDNIPKWSRELKLDNGGLSDLVFEFNDESKIVIEFKMRDTVDAYIRDVEKLSELQDKKIVKLFCAVIDTMKKDLPFDDRVKKINSNPKTKTLYCDSFKTNQTWYKSEVYALIGVWKIN